MKTNLNSIKIVSLSFMILLALFFIACGGGGDGGAPGPAGISYTGLATQAVIDETNAEDFASGAYEGGHTGSAIGGMSVAQTEASGNIGYCRMLKVSQVLEGSLRQVDLMSRLGGTFIGAIYTESDTVYGDCGGSGSYTISVDDETGDFSGSLSFSSYCEDGVTISGSVSFSGQVDVVTGDLLRFSFTFTSLTGTSGSDSFTLSGNISCDLTVHPATMTMSMLVRDNSTGKVYWVKDYTMSVTEGPTYVDVELSGRYYDPDYGYVIVTTSTPFRIYDGDDWPSDGVLVVTGNTGIAGGSTMARLTALSSTTYQVEADTDGDGSYDWDSGVLNWS